MMICMRDGLERGLITELGESPVVVATTECESAFCVANSQSFLEIVSGNFGGIRTVLSLLRCFFFLIHVKFLRTLPTSPFSVSSFENHSLKSFRRV